MPSTILTLSLALNNFLYFKNLEIHLRVLKRYIKSKRIKRAVDNAIGNCHKIRKNELCHSKVSSNFENVTVKNNIVSDHVLIWALYKNILTTNLTSIAESLVALLSKYIAWSDFRALLEPSVIILNGNIRSSNTMHRTKWMKTI